MINEGIELSKDRIGADVIIVASNCDFKDEEFLYSAKPTTRYFKDSQIAFLENEPEVENYTNQFYINDRSLKYMVIGIDFADDFLIKPWLKNPNLKTLADDEAIVGADLKDFGNIALLGKNFKVKSTLGRTGTSMDKSIFINMNTARNYAKTHVRKYCFKGGDAKDFSTAVFVKLKEGKSSQRFEDKINFTKKSIKAISKADSISKLGNSVTGFIELISYLAIILLLNAFLALFGRYTSLMKERKKEVGYLRSLGFSKIKIYLILTAEIAIIATVSGLISSSFVLFVINPVLNILANEFLFPKVFLNGLIILKIIILGPILSFLLGSLSSLVPAIKTAKLEPRVAMSRGEI